MAWPGSVADSSDELTSYTDNNSKTVYMFRVPQGANGAYSKVIFNNGSDATRKITAAADLEPGKNYILGSVAQTSDPTPANIQYGSFAGSGYVYAVTAEDKAAGITKPYDTAGSSNYIYIINNGTDTLGTSGARTPLDEMHVTFYDQDKQIIGTDLAGYIPDLLKNVNYNSQDVYRIRIPNNAKYFRINNGINKGKDGSDEDTHHNERYSEIR